MKRYITRTIDEYDTDVLFVMNGQISTNTFHGIIGKQEAKRILMQTFETKDIVIVSCSRKVVNTSVYRLPEEKFISLAEKVE